MQNDGSVVELEFLKVLRLESMISFVSTGWRYLSSGLLDHLNSAYNLFLILIYAFYRIMHSVTLNLHSKKNSRLIGSPNNILQHRKFSNNWAFTVLSISRESTSRTWKLSQTDHHENQNEFRILGFFEIFWLYDRQDFNYDDKEKFKFLKDIRIWGWSLTAIG